MTHSTDLKLQLFTTNCIIGFAINGLLQSAVRLCPSRTTSRLRLCAAFAAIYALAIAINVALPDLFNAIGAFGSAQPVCAKNVMSCYAAGGATWIDCTFPEDAYPIVCNRISWFRHIGYSQLLVCVYRTGFDINTKHAHQLAMLPFS